MEVIGILLAAGRGARFDASGQRLKLLEPYEPGAAQGGGSAPMAVAAARSLLAGGGTVLAVVRAGRDGRLERLRALLAAAGCRLVEVPADTADEGMGTSIACAVRASAGADGWIIALADMPALAAASVAAVRAAIAAGAASAAPYHQGRRGHPVGFGAACREELCALRGDAGARAVLERHPPVRVPVEDPGVLFDVDVPADLRR